LVQSLGSHPLTLTLSFEIRHPARSALDALLALFRKIRRPLFALLGLTVTALLLAHTDLHMLGKAALGALHVLPFVLAVEALRIAVEAKATGLLYRTRIGFGRLFAAQLESYSVAQLAPAGRAAAEALKIDLLGGFGSLTERVAVAASTQAISLIAVLIASVPCVIAAWRFAGAVLPTIAILTHGLVAGSIGVLLLLALGRKTLGRFLARRFSILSAASEPLDAHVRSKRLALPLLAHVLSRMLQVFQFWMLAGPLGIGSAIGSAFVFSGVSAASAGAADFMPAHLGLSEAAIALSAGMVKTAAATAMALGLLLRAAQVFWVVVSLLIPLFPSARRLRVRSTSRREDLPSESDRVAA
jgi:hypothetical protein